MGGLFLKKILQISVCERRICSAHGSGFNSAKDFLEICARDRGFSHLEGQRVPAGRHNGLPALPADFSLQSLPSKFHFNAFAAGFVTGPPPRHIPQRFADSFHIFFWPFLSCRIMINLLGRGKHVEPVDPSAHIRISCVSGGRKMSARCADRRQISHVVYVNGTRGKSTVSRLIDAGFAPEDTGSSVKPPAVWR